MKKEYVLYSYMPVAQIEQELNIVTQLKIFTFTRDLVPGLEYRTCMLSEQEVVIIRLRYGDRLQVIEVDMLKEFTVSTKLTNTQYLWRRVSFLYSWVWR